MLHIITPNGGSDKDLFDFEEQLESMVANALLPLTPESFFHVRQFLQQEESSLRNTLKDIQGVESNLKEAIDSVQQMLMSVCMLNTLQKKCPNDDTPSNQKSKKS